MDLDLGKNKRKSRECHCPRGTFSAPFELLTPSAGTRLGWATRAWPSHQPQITKCAPRSRQKQIIIINTVHHFASRSLLPTLACTTSTIFLSSFQQLAVSLSLSPASSPRSHYGKHFLPSPSRTSSNAHGDYIILAASGVARRDALT